MISLSPWHLKTHKYLLLLTVLVSTACSETHVRPYGIRSTPIIHGEAAHDDRYSATVAIAILEKGTAYTYCSGVLIEKDVVLTAAHCLADDPSFPFTQLYQDGKIVVITAENTIHPTEDRIFHPHQYAKHPQYRADLSGHDLGLLWLDTPVPEVIATPLPMLADRNIPLQIYHQKKPVEFIGYGLTEEDQDSQRLRAEGFIKKYCPISEKEACAETNSSGEHILFSIGSFMHNIEKAGPCNGDSGGPVLTWQDDMPHILGIIAAGDESCSDYALSTSVPDHYAWIYDTITPTEDTEDCTTTPLKRTSALPIWLIFIGMLCFMHKSIRRCIVKLAKLRS